MIDAKNIGAELAEPRGDLSQNPRAIRNGEAKRNDPLGAFQFADHDRGEDARINVATAQDQADLAAAKPGPLGQHGGEAGGARPFGHRLLQREKRVDGALEQRFVDQNNVAHIVAHDRQREPADIAHGDTFGQRCAAAWHALVMKRVPHRRIERTFDADDLD